MDPSSHFTNRSGVFSGPPWEWETEDSARDADALEAVRRFVSEYGQIPTQDSWAAAGMSPCERTVRKRFGSFRAAVEVASAGDRRVLDHEVASSRYVGSQALHPLPRGERDLEHLQRPKKVVAGA